MNISRLFVSIFEMLEDIVSVPIFALLPGNAIFLSISMYDVEAVSINHVAYLYFFFK